MLTSCCVLLCSLTLVFDYGATSTLLFTSGDFYFVFMINSLLLLLLF